MTPDFSVRYEQRRQLKMRRIILRQRSKYNIPSSLRNLNLIFNTPRLLEAFLRTLNIGYFDFALVNRVLIDFSRHNDNFLHYGGHHKHTEILQYFELLNWGVRTITHYIFHHSPIWYNSRRRM